MLRLGGVEGNLPLGEILYQGCERKFNCICNMALAESSF